MGEQRCDRPRCTDVDGCSGWRELAVPAGLQAVAPDPISYLVTAERALIEGTTTAGEFAWVLLASAGLVGVGPH